MLHIAVEEAVCNINVGMCVSTRKRHFCIAHAGSEEVSQFRPKIKLVI